MTDWFLLTWAVSVLITLGLLFILGMYALYETSRGAWYDWQDRRRERREWAERERRAATVSTYSGPYDCLNQTYGFKLEPLGGFAGSGLCVREEDLR